MPSGAPAISAPVGSSPKRGTRFNTGDGIRMALEIGAMSWGNWSGCHAVGWERNAPEFGDLTVGDQFQKHSYPLGIIVNAEGKRFVDEGADFRNYTYAKYGAEVLKQPGQFAWQVFDSKVLAMLRDEYRIRQVTKTTADTLEELAAKMEDVDAEGFLATVQAFNAAVKTDVPFDPNVKDGRRTEGIDPPKSNWANSLVDPPFEAYAITCGITFTFGGLKIDTGGEVLDTDAQPIPGLYAAGELVGGLFYFNYPGGTGLMSGAVFGRIAGRSAAEAAVRATDHAARDFGRLPAARVRRSDLGPKADSLSTCSVCPLIAKSGHWNAFRKALLKYNGNIGDAAAIRLVAAEWPDFATKLADDTERQLTARRRTAT